MSLENLMSDNSARLDAFTDAAFAFAVTLLVIGGASQQSNLETLFQSIGEIPSFAVGFAIISMFWWGHVRWRNFRGPIDNWRTIFLTLILIFLTLIYVQPLRAMASAMAFYFTGQGAGFKGDLSSLFTVYGIGFVAMSLAMAALYREAAATHAPGKSRAEAFGNVGIWLILAVTGSASIALSFTYLGIWAATVYSTLPLTIGAFSGVYDWEGRREKA